MSKTLTEQWREGTLEYGYYYVKHTFGWKPFGITIDFWHGPFDKWGAIPNDYVLEVLAHGPSYDEYKRLVSKNDELVQKMHILNEQNTKQYNELCEEIKKNNILEKRLEIATKALERINDLSSDNDGINDGGIIWCALNALKEMEGVK